MSHSLRVKIKGLQYKGIITDKDCDRLCKALDNESVLDKIRTDIEEYKSRRLGWAIGTEDLETGKQIALKYVLALIDEYKTESEDKK